jgi:8-oxo-dGTP pyrophosphatase MutT (NUDIX family)
MKWNRELENPDKLYSLVHSRLERHQPRVYQYAEVSYREAAILIPFFFKDNIPHLLFTKRTEKVEHHKGQISFPGGMLDKKDKDLKTTALRETFEEVGIHERDITLLGRTDQFLTNTNFMVTPYVGYYTHPYIYKVNTDEIAHLIEVPLPHLLKPEIFEVKKWEREGILWDVHFYYYNNEVIWGVTGFLLSNFLSIVFDMQRMPQ